jgi:UPF0271 protein
MRQIDLNADIGEGGDQDGALIALVSSANIACGGHAGDAAGIRQAIDTCLAAGVAVGAHPGYADREHFGRKPLALSAAEVRHQIREQLRFFAGIADQAGAAIHHVKPHGALYNQADRDPELAAAVIAAAQETLGQPLIYCPPGGEMAKAAVMAGLTPVAEGFVDRRYLSDGSLVPRGEIGAVIEGIPAAVAQAVQIARDQCVSTIDGTQVIPLAAESLCVHGDGQQAAELMRQLRNALIGQGLTILSGHCNNRSAPDP